MLELGLLNNNLGVPLVSCLRDLPPPKRFGEGWSRYGEGRRSGRPSLK
jgi:hypothetical protein